MCFSVAVFTLHFSLTKYNDFFKIKFPHESKREDVPTDVFKLILISFIQVNRTLSSSWWTLTRITSVTVSWRRSDSTVRRRTSSLTSLVECRPPPSPCVCGSEPWRYGHVNSYSSLSYCSIVKECYHFLCIPPYKKIDIESVKET